MCEDLGSVVTATVSLDRLCDLKLMRFPELYLAVR
jgi:hypothetical protein